MISNYFLPTLLSAKYKIYSMFSSNVLIMSQTCDHIVDFLLLMPREMLLWLFSWLTLLKWLNIISCILSIYIYI